MTSEEVEELKRASQFGLLDVFTDDGYVYLVDENGEDAGWTGFYGGLSGNLPYKTCTIHNEYTWSGIEETTPEDEFGGIVIPGEDGTWYPGGDGILW